MFLSFGRLSLYPVGFSLSVSLLFLFQNKILPALPLSFLLFPVLHSLCIYRQRERGPSCPALSWQSMVAAWGRLLHSRPCLCRVWPFWREGVVVSVKGQVGALVFWVLGERERIKNGRENASSSPVLCVSRGRRRLMVPFKTAPFASFFFLQ